MIQTFQKSRLLVNIFQTYRSTCLFTTSTSNLKPRGFDNNAAFTERNKNIADEEIKTLEKLEENFFENNEYKPVDSKKLLKEFKDQVVEEFQNEIREKKEIRNKINVKSSRKISRDSPEVIEHTELQIKFKKLKIDDPLLGQLFIEARSKKKNHDKNKQIVIEGWRLISEAIDCGLKLKSLFFIKNENLEPILSAVQKLKDTEIYKVPQQSLRTWSTLTTCPGLIAICEHKSNDSKKWNSDKMLMPITVICDNIREPSNLGSIIRTCAAIPCLQVITVKGCCDPWETKALRGGCGGQFRIDIKDDVTWETLDELLPEICSVFIAECNLQNAINSSLCTYDNVQVSDVHNCVIIGGETGVSEDAYRFMKYRNGICLNIPLAKGINSLNTSSALTLILFEMRRHLQLQALKSEETDYTKSYQQNLQEITK